MWSLRRVLRLAHAEACQELSDRARGLVSSYGDAHAQPGEMVEEAERLVADAEEVLVLAVAYERRMGTSWEQVGERLGEGVSRQAATKRFASRVEQLELDALLPARQGPPGRLGWWAGAPDAARDPAGALERLDAWAHRHREPADGGREHAGRLVSHGLRADRTSDLISATTRLADLLLNATGPFADRQLPPGVSEPYARGRLLEAKVASFTLMLDETLAGRERHEVAVQLERCLEEFTVLRVEQAREHLTLTWTGEHAGQVCWHERPLAEIARTVDRKDPEATGWFLLAPGDGSGVPDRVEGVEVDAEREHVEHAALQQLAYRIGSDQAKGVGPFDPGGIAGPAGP